MSTKDDILSRIRSHTGTRYEKPEITLDAITYADKLKQFSDSLEAAGGQVAVWQPDDDINELIRRHFPGGKTYRFESARNNRCHLQSGFSFRSQGIERYRPGHCGRLFRGGGERCCLDYAASEVQSTLLYSDSPGNHYQ